MRRSSSLVTRYTASWLATARAPSTARVAINRIGTTAMNRYAASSL